ncbi:hypothetical protein BH11BAC3_BH11BAC3_39620 [soil metagenome]
MKIVPGFFAEMTFGKACFISLVNEIYFSNNFLFSVETIPISNFSLKDIEPNLYRTGNTNNIKLIKRD